MQIHSLAGCSCVKEIVMLSPTNSDLATCSFIFTIVQCCVTYLPDCVKMFGCVCAWVPVYALRVVQDQSQCPLSVAPFSFHTHKLNTYVCWLQDNRVNTAPLRPEPNCQPPVWLVQGLATGWSALFSPSFIPSAHQALSPSI